MTGFECIPAMVDGAIRELRSLAAAALARALEEPAEFPAHLPHMAALLMPEGRAPAGVLRRGAGMNRAMPFAAFDPASRLQHRVLASGLRPGLPERVATRLRRRRAEVPPGWIDAVLSTALAAPAFLAQAQGTAWRGLRSRAFFAPGGPPSEPLSVATLLVLIVWSGRPGGLPPPAWARLEDVARQMADRPGWAGPTDRLVLAEARKTFGRTGTDAGQAEKGIGNVPG